MAAVLVDANVLLDALDAEEVGGGGLPIEFANWQLHFYVPSRTFWPECRA